MIEVLEDVQFTEGSAGQTVDPSAVAEAVLAGLDARQQEQAQLAGELIPVAEELAPVLEELGVIKTVVQLISDFFQEDDHDVLTDIRDDLSGLREYLEEQQQPEAVIHPMLTTNFVDYTVTEGLLLLILLFLIIQQLLKMAKEAFAWLL